jgi:O-antigen/teichoic acid export membrane protein
MVCGDDVTKAGQHLTGVFNDMTPRSATVGFNLGRNVKRGVAWTLTARGIAIFMNFGASIVLARLLEPEDFGIFGLAMIFIGIASRFGNIGFGLALIQQKELRDEHVSSIFVVHLLLFSVITGMIISISPLVGSYFGNPLVGRALSMMAWIFVAHAFSSIAKAILQRRMDFRGPAVANMVDHIASTLTSITLASLGYGMWSLVYGHVVGSLLSALVLVVKARWKPVFRYRQAAMKELFSFGLNIFLKNLLVYGSDKVDYFIIGKQLGPAALGLYEKAFNVMDLGVKELSTKVGAGVLFPAFSRIQEDQERLRSVYTKVILSLTLVCFPFFVGLFLVAPSAIYVLFGEKWMASVMPLQILCLAGLFRTHLHVTGTVINAMGKVAPEVWIRAAAFILLTVGCLIGSLWGIVAVAVAVTATTAVLMLLMVSYLKRLTDLSWLDFIRPQCAPLLGSMFMALVVLIYQRWFEASLGVHSIGMLLSSTAVGAVSYMAALWLLKPAPVVSLIKELTGDLRLVFQRTTP